MIDDRTIYIDVGKLSQEQVIEYMERIKKAQTNPCTELPKIKFKKPKTYINL